MGERALLVEVADTDAVLALHAGLAASVPVGVVELVPAARTLLVRFDPERVRAATVRAWIADAVPGSPADVAGSEVALDVVYDGPDLEGTARSLGLSADALVQRHVRSEWRVAFTGFTPGFGYLVGSDWPYDVPRLDAPRTRVPAGSVGLAAGFTGAYPRDTPGGWRLIGTTAATLFDPSADAPALLTPGTRVHFAAVRERVLVAEVGDAGRSPDAAAAVRIDAAGNATVQDLGRPGVAHLGMSRSGALDRGALRLGNRLVGNAEDAAGIEIAPGGFAATARRDVWVAVTGTWVPLTLDGRAVAPYRAQLWPAGERLELGWPARGARAYLALRGGVDAPTVLGSRATDTLAGLGPEPLRAGGALRLGERARRPVPPLDIAPWGWPPDVLALRLRPGPRSGWFTASAHRALAEATWTVSVAADRVGVRLDGPALERERAGELPSEPMVPGAVQVPPAGRPLILLADGPVTGGYPVIGVVDDASLDLLAQAPPGTLLRFRPGSAP
jgi:KipI family sensor histidine kinase inhibitor